jgi:hypothetical protein
MIMSSLTRAFGVSRMSVGALSWLAPVTATRVLGLRPGSDPVITQLFGARDLALGALVACGVGEQLTQALKVGVAIDIADVVGCLRRRESLSLQGKVLTAGGAVLFATVGAGALAAGG